MKKVEYWKCDYCRRATYRKGVMVKHENQCFRNPEVRACASCVFRKRVDAVVDQVTGQWRRMNDLEKGLLEGDGNPLYWDSDGNLREDWQYVLESIPKTVCLKKGVIMDRLTTNCDIYEQEVWDDEAKEDAKEQRRLRKKMLMAQGKWNRYGGKTK